MKTTIAATVALAACLSTQVFAAATSSTGNTKQDTITLALTLQGQSSVSTSATVANAGNFSQGPLYYKTSSKKFTQVDLLKAIAYVIHNKNAGYYSSQASLVLVQGELGGFWNINDGLAQSFRDFYTDWSNPYDPDCQTELTGSFNGDGYWYYNTNTSAYFPGGALPSVYFPGSGYLGGSIDQNGDIYGYDYTGFGVDFTDYIPNFTDANDNSSRTSISDGVNEYSRLDTGRHFLPVPWEAYQSDVGTPYPTTGQYPVGHMQPWGQIYVKDPGHKDSSGNPLCENVTFFFNLQVQECYDCFYLSSFISDATFKNATATQSGPPCCTPPGYLLGKGTDKYYLTFSFDNTINNCYLNNSIAWYTNYDSTSSSGFTTYSYYYYPYVGFDGVYAHFLSGNGNLDGLSPDALVYSDPIRSRLGLSSPYETRFTLNGIVTYAWTLTLVNSTDAAYDYVGTANYAANGYGFIGLICDLITGTATFSEKVVKDIGCCDDENWYDNTWNCNSCNGEANNYSLVTGWYGTGWDGGEGYFYPLWDQYNPYPFYNVVGGEVYSDAYYDEMPNQYESPFNPQAALTRHGIINNYSHCLDCRGEEIEYLMPQ
jgi:hypothetical protein